MICCPSCQNLYSSENLLCSHCGFAPEIVAGMPAWAPEMANAGGGFKPEYFAKLYKLEAAHFWFRARNTLIMWILKKYAPDLKSFLEIGCGTGYVLSGVAAAFPDAKISGSEIFTEGLFFAASRVKGAKFMQMDGTRIPFVDEFDVIGVFDVIEHIDDDESVLAGIYKAVKPGGYMLLTVPQHPSLWSSADDYWCHVRRYTSTEIHQKIVRAGFEIVKTTSFVSLLLPGMVALRSAGRDKGGFDGFDELNNNPVVNKAMGFVSGIEQLLIQMGVSFPVGGSRLVLAKKGVSE